MARIEGGRVFFVPRELKAAIDIATHIRRVNKGKGNKRARFEELVSPASILFGMLGFPLGADAT